MSNWQELGRDVTKLRHKVDNLDKSWEQVDRKLNELVQLAEFARLLTYVAIIAVMTTLLLNQYFG